MPDGSVETGIRELTDEKLLELYLHNVGIGNQLESESKLEALVRKFNYLADMQQKMKNYSRIKWKYEVV